MPTIFIPSPRWKCLSTRRWGLDDNEAKFAGLMGNDSEWYFIGAKLFPNVKGCGYPPMLNCSIFYRQYAIIGQNFSCYYSKVDPGIVISDLDMWQVSLQFSIFSFLLLKVNIFEKIPLLIFIFFFFFVKISLFKIKI